MGAESGFSPDQKQFRVMACGSITQKEIETEKWMPVFLFDQDNLSEWNNAADIVAKTNKSEWDIAIGPDPSDSTKSAVYKRTLDPTGQLTLGN